MGLFGVLLICHNLFFALVMCHLVIGDHGYFVVHPKSRALSAGQTVTFVWRQGARSAGELGDELI